MHPGVKHVYDLLVCEQDMGDSDNRVWQIYASVAREVVYSCNEGPEVTVALRKLLESRDAAMRCRSE